MLTLGTNGHVSIMDQCGPMTKMKMMRKQWTLTVLMRMLLLQIVVSFFIYISLSR